MYRVCGVTREVAEIKAVKLISEGKGTMEEFKNDLDAYTDNVFRTMKPVSLSCIYSNYNEAYQYAMLAELGGRDIVIKYKAGEKNRAGNYIVDPKTNKIKMHWVVMGS